MRTLHAAGLLALAALSAIGIAIAADPPPNASALAPLASGERERLLEDAKARHERARALRSEAADVFRRSEAACYDKIMVSSCIEDAKQERLRKTLEARHLDVSADRLRREVKLRENAQREAQSADASQEREAAVAEAAARSSEEAQARAAEQARRDAERERDLQEAPARAAAEAASRRKAADDAAQRQSAEAERASKRAASAARDRAEIDRRAAEHAKRRAEAQAAAKAPAAGAAGDSSAPK